MANKTVLSGIQPSGVFTLGNYIGAVRNWKNVQAEYDCYYMVADLHTLTVRDESDARRRNSYQAFANMLAAGIDPDKSTVFIQSHVHQHAELSWILSCYTMFGELSRMTQFKEKSQRHKENINAGLFTYPTLMAADILIYQADYVPVGLDQKQHVEISRDIAARFNALYSETFKMPEPLIYKSGAKIMSLAEPEKKMSKSDTNPGATIFMFDSPEDIMKKFKRAVTDSGSTIERGEGRHGINNLITIYSVAAGITEEETEKAFSGKGYGQFKTACAEAVIELLRPIREKTVQLMDEPRYLEQLFAKGAERAAKRAEETVKDVKEKVGLILS